MYKNEVSEFFCISLFNYLLATPDSTCSCFLKIPSLRCIDGVNDCLQKSTQWSHGSTIQQFAYPKGSLLNTSSHQMAHIFISTVGLMQWEKAHNSCKNRHYIGDSKGKYQQVSPAAGIGWSCILCYKVYFPAVSLCQHNVHHCRFLSRSWVRIHDLLNQLASEASHTVLALRMILHSLSGSLKDGRP